MRFKKLKFNILVIVMTLLMGVSFIVPTLNFGSSSAGSQSEAILSLPPSIQDVQNKDDPPSSEEKTKLNFKTAEGALKYGNNLLALQNGYITEMKLYADLKAKFLGLPIKLAFNADGFKFVNEDLGVDMFGISLLMNYAPLINIDMNNYFSVVSDELIISQGEGYTQGEYFNSVSEIKKENAIRDGEIYITDNYLTIPNSSIITSKIERKEDCFKVSLKVKNNALDGMIRGFFSIVSGEYSFSVTAPIDIVCYVSCYGELISAQYGVNATLSLNTPIGNISLEGRLNLSEIFYNKYYGPVIEKYKEVTRKFSSVLPREFKEGKLCTKKFSNEELYGK